MKRFLIVIPSLLISLVLHANQQTVGYLGFAVDRVPATVKAHFPDEAANADGVVVDGVIVTQLADISPAADEGIKLYDILIGYDDQAVSRIETLIETISKDQPGRTVQLKVLRQGKILTIPVTIGQQRWAPLPQLQMQQYMPLKNTRKTADKPTNKPSSTSTIRANPAAAARPLNIAGKPMLPMRKKREKEAWGDERNIWPDFYTDSTNDMWNDMINGPFKMGRMPGGWRAPALSMPDPVTIGDAVTNQIPPIMEEAGNMTDFSD